MDSLSTPPDQGSEPEPGSTPPPPTRRGDPTPHRRDYLPVRPGPRDRDTVASANRFRIFAWSLVGAFLGYLLGVFLTETGRGGPRVMMWTISIGWAVSFVLPFIILRLAAGAGRTLFVASGSTTPHTREYSQAEAYAARGQYQEAIATFAAAIAADRRDPTPYLRVARLHRDRLRNNDEAARWFRRALEESQMNSGQWLLTGKELVELYEVRMRTPGRAAPLLARIAEEAEGTARREWAAAELSRIKRLLPGEQGPS